jgi:hypothetical protein
LELLGDWRDASAIVLSCPGPLRRHGASILPAQGLALPQMLLGAESQLLAFMALAAAVPEDSCRLHFAPFPELFHGPASLQAALPAASGGAVHLRFGGVRAARLLKGARNACVLAERAGPAPLTASHHPFASGSAVPAAMLRAYAMCADAVHPSRIGGGELPLCPLPEAILGMGLQDEPAHGDDPGLDMACLAGFRSDAWAAGPVTEAGPQGPCVLLPWNMDHPGSIIATLLERLAGLQAGGQVPAIVLLPFNYVGQTGIIRDLIALLRDATAQPGAALGRLFVARVRNPAGIANLKRLSNVAWVDGNDPEHWWTLGRLSACGFATLLLDAGMSGTDASRAAGTVAADEQLWVEAETRCGALTFAARIPPLRALPGLLRLTAELQVRTADKVTPSRRPRRAKAGAA